MSNHHARAGDVWPGLGFLVLGRGMLFPGHGPGVNHVALFTLDTLYTAVQSAGEVKASEMVHDPDKEKKKIIREIVQIILSRNQKTSSFVDWKDLKLVYKRYASLYFCCAIEDQDNELLTLEVVHRYVELLDRYFGNVCELDIIFNFEKAYFILDEFIIGGEVQETSKKTAVKAIEDSDMLQETVEEYMNKPAF
ncbi:PREDICTED: AP-1 complex subunit sigma-3 isoform X1 [Corvus brachyrhynchos]|uniref:AP-1 complex subunit sigma-3 isoform X1 n=2 Tax=Corvus brachyrhynchos TaxID=85066 RepID=UPI0008163EE5|nr:PREDICTED: AP-1 complex subunit sigma-3 isoform X1 [Corvus brachyrhynchos]